ncbi:DUF3841 domain-containing protein [Schnuerera ultunensis]|uniref:DUF3841 domain-containing protein n=1 Tax=Schnuerera ultunensis TaxID=45497 RepID=UPI000407A7B9|nr:DUF3841 domain-containing protein [Schnuerera ultunensis]
MIAKKYDSKKATLWTRQNIKSLDDLRNNGIIRITRKHLEEKFEEIADYIIELYNWFTNAANNMISKPKEVEFPIWCSINEENMLRPTLDAVVYVLEVDESEIIYFDGMKWDYVLNHLYIPRDARDEEEYRKNIKKKGFKDIFSVMDERTIHFYPEERKRIMDSWMRIFEIDEWNIFRVQANIWEIRPEMVKDILYYKEV